MRDSRVSFFAGTPNLAVSTATTINGTTIDTKSGYVGDYFEGVPEGYGIGIEVMFTSIVSTNNNVVLKWQMSSDNSTWTDGFRIYDAELSASKGTNGTKVIVPTRLDGLQHRYVRLVIVTTGMAGSSFVVNAWLSDGTTDVIDGSAYLRV